MTSTPALEMHRVIWPPTPSKNSVTGAFYDRVSGENKQTYNNDSYFLIPEEMIKMDTANKPTVRPTAKITQTNIS